MPREQNGARRKGFIRPTPDGIRFMEPATLIATWGGSGLLRPAPGTWGSLAALPFGYALMSLTGPFGLIAGILLSFIIGIWAAGSVERRTGDKDGGYIVIDEVSGQWLALLPALASPWLILPAFLFFRLFDIAKPWPCFQLQSIGGGLGVMIDDIVAGLYAALATALVGWGLQAAGLLVLDLAVGTPGAGG
jgi:phosphatidylglycerophosphatase A